MEKAADAGAGTADGSKEVRIGVAAALALCISCPSVWAQGAAQPAELMAQAQSQSEPAMRVQVQTSTLPRLDAMDSGFQAPRVDVSLFPAARRTGLGAVVGMSGFAGRQNPQLGLQPQRPSIDLGVRWSQRVHSQQIDIMAWRRMDTDDDAYSLVQARQPVYGARVEMNLSGGRKRGLAADLGFIGLQMQSGARISIKRKNGGPMIYYRTTF
jgi:hypothetical protein